MIYWILVIISLVGIDQITKAMVVANFTAVRDTYPVIQDFFHITYVRNSGAVFGIFEGLAEKYVIFLVIMGIAIIILGYLFIKNDFKDKKLVVYTLAISLLLAGAFGNLIDRIFQFDHNVVDFIDFRGIWDYVFNFADMCLNVGIGLLVIDQFILEPKRNKLKNG